MTTYNPIAIRDQIISVLNANLTDPLGSERRGNFVVDTVKDFAPQTPIVTVAFIGAPLPQTCIGSPTYEMEARFQITIKMGEKEKIDIDSDGTRDDCEKVLGSLAKSILEAIETYKSSMTYVWNIYAERINPILYRDGFCFLTIDVATLSEI